MDNNKDPDCGAIDDDKEETISDSFVCCVCLDLLYKPIVLDCGHVSCFWCVHKSMNGVRESNCPICRHSYHHFPTICEMLHFLLLKMYPHAYRRREKQILEEETQSGFFAPQLDGKDVGVSTTSQDSYTLSTIPSVQSEVKDCFKEDSIGSAAIEEQNLSGMDYDGKCNKVTINDVLCPACKEVLFRPVVLNCGHGYCEVCVIVPDHGIIKCKVCKSPHPTDLPNVCLELNQFLEQSFPKEYAVRKQNVEQKQAPFQHKNPPASSSQKKSAQKGYRRPSETSEDLVQWWSQNDVHYGVGCDYCGVYPIKGDRYKCLDCEEKIGFDLCGDCYNTRSKRPGRFNQQHTPDHKFKLVKRSDFIENILSQLAGGPNLDNNGAPVLAISAVEDSPDGWIAIESAIANAIAPDGDGIDAIHDNDTQDGPVPVEFSDAQEVFSHDMASSDHHDDNTEQDGNL